jgi:tetratricopeptide (TPR) repeat protein
MKTDPRRQNPASTPRWWRRGFVFLVGYILLSSVVVQAQQQADESIAAQARLAREAEARGDFRSAIRNYTELTRLLPEVAEVFSNLGVACYFDKQFPKALDAFKRALELKPELTAAVLFSGLSYYQMSEPERAIPYLKKAAALAPGDPVPPAWLGYANLACSRPEEAIIHLRTAGGLDPGNIDVWYALGESYLKLGQKKTKKLVEAAPDGARTWQLAAEGYSARGDKGQAIVYLKEALRRKPGDPEISGLLDRLSRERGESPGPSGNAGVSGSDARSAAAEALYRSVRECAAGAQAAFERIAAIAPDSYRAHQVIAESLAKEPSEEAVNEFRIVLRLKPDLPGIHAKIGGIRFAQARLDEAAEEYDAELALQPFSAYAHSQKARVLVAMGKDQEAQMAIAKALSLPAPPVECQFLLAKLLQRKDDSVGAAKALERYLAAKPNDAPAHYQLARLYTAMHRPTDAAREFALFKKHSPDEKGRSRAEKAMASFAAQTEPAEGAAPAVVR